MKRLALSLILFLFANGVWAQNALPPVGTMSSVIFAGTTTISNIISNISGKRIYLTNITIHPASTAVVTLSYGTGINCGTGTQAFYGPATFQAGENIYDGSGAGVIYIVPSGQDVCITIATAVAPGWISYAQF